MSINAIRQDFFLKFLNLPVSKDFVHEPATGEPTQPAFPDTLDAGEQAALKEWRATSGTTAAALYAALSVTAQTKADEFVAWDAERNAWKTNDDSARQQQYAWFMADAAIVAYDTDPPSGNTGGTGSGGSMTPLTRQEP